MNQRLTTLRKFSQLARAKRMTGLSLIELMIGMTISSLLLIGVTSIYFNARESDKFTSELSRIQESGRLTLDFLSKEIRMAGYLGCMDPQPGKTELRVFAHNPPTEDREFFDTALSGFEVPTSTWAQDANVDPDTGRNRGEYFRREDFANDAKLNSDIILIQRLSVDSAKLAEYMETSSDPIILPDNDMNFNESEIAVVGNCNTSVMFRISDDPNATAITTLTHRIDVNDRADVREPFTTDATVRKFESTLYFVADTGRKTGKGHTINALYRATDRMVNSDNPEFDVEELIEGVDSLQILYGELWDVPDDDPNTNDLRLRYVTADEVRDMDKVTSVQIGLLVSGTQEVLTENDAAFYNLPGVTIKPEGEFAATVTHPGDKRLRREFTQTIQLRNRNLRKI